MRITFVLLCYICSFPLMAQEADSKAIEYFNTIDSINKTGQYKQALPLSLEYVNYAQSVYGKQDTSYARAIRQLNYIYTLLGQLDKAEPLAKELLAIYKKAYGVEDPRYAEALNIAGYMAFRRGNYSQTEKYMREEMRIKKKKLGTQHKDYGLILNNMGVLYERIGLQEEAEAMYQEAKAIWEETIHKDSLEYAFKYAKLLSNIAALYSHNKKYAAAEPYLRSSLDIRQRLLGEKHPSYAQVLNNYGYNLCKQGNTEKGLEFLKASLAIEEEVQGRESENYGGALMNVGLVLFESGELETSIPMLEEATRIIRRAAGRNSYLYAIALTNKSKPLLDNEKYDEVLPIFEEVLDIRTTIFGEKHPDRARSIKNLAVVHMNLKDYDKALNLSYEALLSNTLQDLIINDFKEKWTSSLIEAQFSSVEVTMDVLNVMAVCYDSLYHQTKDEKYLEKNNILVNAWAAYATYIRQSFHQNEDKKAVLNESAKIALKGINVSLQYYQKNQDPKYLEQALNFADNNKSNLLNDALKSEAAISFGGLTDSLVLKERELKQQRTRLKKNLIEAKTQKNEALVSTIQQKRVALDEAIKKHKQLLEDNYPAYHQFQYQEEPLDVKELQNKYLSETSALLEFAHFDAQSYLIVVTQKQLDVIQLSFNRKELHELIAQLRKGLSDYEYLKSETEQATQEYVAAARDLYQKLLAEALEKLQDINHLIIIPDGQMSHIPFEVLLTETIAPEEELDYKALPYLLNKYAISYSFSSQLLVSNKSQARSSAKGKLLAMAADYGNSEDINELRSYRYDRHIQLRKVLQPIPAAKKEVENLQQNFGNSGEFLMGAAATEAKFKELAADYEMIHLAMHGILNKQHPLLSSLAFTENQDSTEDNFLESHEISQMQLNANLVVLSACETGYGKFRQGEGIMSMARSFMYAGVPAMVVSLWSVNDESTAFVMQVFYEQLAAGKSKAAALQQAKQTYLQQAEGLAAHPAFWAPFIQIGDESPLELSMASTSSWGWRLAGGLGLLALGGLALTRRRKE